MAIKLGLGLDLYRGAQLELPVEQVQRAESLGYHSVWTAEAYGADALSPLAFLAAVTRRIKLATGVVQTAARTPAATAMHAMTIDALAGGGRTIIGLGLSGPQIVEGWYGRPWGSPNAVLRDYVAIMRKVLARDEPLIHDGPEYPLPTTASGSVGSGKALKSILHPHPGIEIWLAAGGPRNTELAAQVADGWLPMGFGADGLDVHGAALARGSSKRSPALGALEIFGGINIEICTDVAAAIERRKPLTAMYVGGMGSATHNFHRDAMARRGYSIEADRIQGLWLAGRKQEAVAAVPDEYIEQGAALGPPDRIRRVWADHVHPGVTGLIVRSGQDEALDLAAELAEIEPPADLQEEP